MKSDSDGMGGTAHSILLLGLAASAITKEQEISGLFECASNHDGVHEWCLSTATTQIKIFDLSKLKGNKSDKDHSDTSGVRA